MARLDEAGQTVLLVALDDTILGAIGARDRVRPEAPGVLAALRDLGIDGLAMLTGDRAAVAHAVARQLETEEAAGSQVHAELLPHQKAKWKANNEGAGARGEGREKREDRETRVTTSLAPRPCPRPSLCRHGRRWHQRRACPGRADVGLALAARGSDLAAEAGDIVFLKIPSVRCLCWSACPGRLSASFARTFSISPSASTPSASC